MYPIPLSTIFSRHLLLVAGHRLPVNAVCCLENKLVNLLRATFRSLDFGTNFGERFQYYVQLQ